MKMWKPVKNKFNKNNVVPLVMWTCEHINLN